MGADIYSNMPMPDAHHGAGFLRAAAHVPKQEENIVMALYHFNPVTSKLRLKAFDATTLAILLCQYLLVI